MGRKNPNTCPDRDVERAVRLSQESEAAQRRQDLS